ncbi:type II toxin-antitoxin system RelE/ParE family toxin [Moraxella sp. FZLJ2107]|uniref:type II toxin-antitoxin system RelE/ParE family toxin n=1 Tax=unclassified Moraxella TaxID=2685852 RepID=UPI0020C91D30|nr:MULTISPECIES: type II toxin-antitoxin system RelE/ParE family toxin [unclassified Moraxella]UTO05834.1 type II toxin-antitoxin system RelE/ParE family toxin [Moraxella sp. FZLJ2107]UTO22570.1 type II toxin-antitoxin system RelE/ParE family toxin [Moraxella sp. FZLJ2109]
MMYTIAETDQFIRQVDDIWTDDERLEFFEYLANNPLKGDVIPALNGLRKIRYAAKGHGKRGGARIIYYNMLDDGLIIAVAIYPKNEQENLSQAKLKQLAKDKE